MIMCTSFKRDMRSVAPFISTAVKRVQDVA